MCSLWHTCRCLLWRDIIEGLQQWDYTTWSQPGAIWCTACHCEHISLFSYRSSSPRPLYFDCELCLQEYHFSASLYMKDVNWVISSGKCITKYYMHHVQCDHFKDVLPVFRAIFPGIFVCILFLSSELTHWTRCKISRSILSNHYFACKQTFINLFDIINDDHFIESGVNPNIQCLFQQTLSSGLCYLFRFRKAKQIEIVTISNLTNSCITYRIPPFTQRCQHLWFRCNLYDLFTPITIVRSSHDFLRFSKILRE